MKKLFLIALLMVLNVSFICPMDKALTPGAWGSTKSTESFLPLGARLLLSGGGAGVCGVVTMKLWKMTKGALEEHTTTKTYYETGSLREYISKPNISGVIKGGLYGGFSAITASLTYVFGLCFLCGCRMLLNKLV